MGEYRHTTGAFIGDGGVEIFFQSWTVERPKAVVVIAHGLGEHSGRYRNIIQKMKGKGFSFFALDHRGFGKSGGSRGQLDSFIEFTNDLKHFVNLIRAENRNTPLFMLGHSMGGVIALKYALTFPEDVAFLVLSAPALILAVALPAWKRGVGKLFSKYLPKFAMASGLNPEEISHDAEVVRNYREDPLVHDRATVRLYTEFMDAAEECLRRAAEIRMPLLLIHGTGDRLVSYKGTEEVFRRTFSRDKEICLFEGLFHETMNEAERDRAKVLDSISRWMMARLAARKGAAGVKPKAKKAAQAKAKKKATPAKKKRAGEKGGSPAAGKNRSVP